MDSANQGNGNNVAPSPQGAQPAAGGATAPAAAALSYGKKAVGLSFNPSGDPKVNDCKTAYAQIIDALDEARTAATSNEIKRLYSTAITQAQSAQMWAVKAITWKD